MLMKPDHSHARRGAAWYVSMHQLVSALAGVVHLDVPEQSPLSSVIAVMTGVELLIRCSDGDSRVRLKGEESFVFAFRMRRLQSKWCKKYWAK